MSCKPPINWPAQVTAYHNGEVAASIAKRVGVSDVTVFRQLRKHGAEIRRSRATKSQEQRRVHIEPDAKGYVECPTCHSKGRGQFFLDGYEHRCGHNRPCRGATKGAGVRCLECEPEVRV